ncbi:ferric iron uptake transcriptional regulator [Litorivicinus sp.]|jgi:Fur family ferric uptake transcriptional regulator|nr:ferric iron uptake transcriptional regulator [Litorivicinus sp.]MDB9861763.1 ferric iron uptake transcriptional regulator [Litorivicinus sp.]MDC1239507.1 ferric iron uptake transcriptional regulator [Litorivicinus sp.]MDC1319068.1 ferric iron uptake transcriptional regulator [Litorivicinus sp.]|tara:strand:+ start:762 stop:1178 length:417 start_codon:yes stop_codon:yes gene_type:complete
MQYETKELKKVGLKATLPRIHVLQLLLSAEGEHMSAEVVYRKLHEAGVDVNLATIYRVLTQFQEAGLVERHQFDTATNVFELKSDSHHDHMVCVRCQKVIEYVSPEIESLQEKIAADHECEIVDHTHIIYVVCPSCRS